jgi:hypothetical protein
MSAKVTIREIDGTEYQLKKRIAEMVLASGYSRKVTRGLHEMLSVRLVKALSLMDSDGQPVYAYGTPYIPVKLPPKELRNVIFEPPLSAEGQNYHKLVLKLAYEGIQLQ